MSLVYLPALYAATVLEKHNALAFENGFHTVFVYERNDKCYLLLVEDKRKTAMLFLKENKKIL